MLAIRLPKEVEARLDKLAKDTGRTKSYYAREAILSYMDDLEDTYLALKILDNPGKIYSMDEVKKQLGLED